MTIRFAPAVPLSAVQKLAADIGCHLVNDGRGGAIITPRTIYRAGDCEICGHWDSSLLQGACPTCRKKYHITERST